MVTLILTSDRARTTTMEELWVTHVLEDVFDEDKIYTSAPLTEGHRYGSYTPLYIPDGIEIEIKED